MQATNPEAVGFPIVILIPALALLLFVGFALARRFGLPRVLLVAISGTVIGLMVLTFLFTSSSHTTPSQVTHFDLSRLTAELTISEQTKPPAAWSDETDAFSPDVYPTHDDAANSLARHVVGPLRKAFALPSDSHLTSEHAVVILERRRHNVAPSILQDLRDDLKERFPEATVELFVAHTNSNVDIQQAEDAAEFIEEIRGKESVLVTVDVSKPSANELSEFSLSASRDGQFHNAIVPFVNRPWVNSHSVGNERRTRFRSQQLADRPEIARQILRGQLADVLTEEFKQSPYRLGLSRELDVTSRIHECLPDDPAEWLGASNTFEQTLTKPDGEKAYRIAVNLYRGELDRFFARISADPRGDTLLIRASSLYPYAGLFSFVVGICFALRWISQRVSDSNLANLAQE